MTIIVDTGVLYADHDTAAPRQETATTALDAVYRGEFGQPYISDYIYDEAITLTLTRGSFVPAKRLGQRLRGADNYPKAYEILHVSPAVFRSTVERFERYDDQELSFTDATTVALAEHRGIDAVLSFDDDFDGLVDRVSPADV